MALSYRHYCSSSILAICIGAPENYTLASLLTMCRPWRGLENSTLLIERLQQDMDAGTTWNNDCMMLLSAKKLQITFFSTNSHENKWQLTLTLDGHSVCYNTTPKFLGVSYDRQRTLCCHAAHVGNSLRRQAGAL